MHARNLFTLPASLQMFASLGNFFNASAAPWQWVSDIKPALKAFVQNEGAQEASALTLLAPSQPGSALFIGESVHVHPSVQLPAYGHIEGPCYIGEGTQLRPGVYIRGHVIAGENCVLGNSCEYKNCLLMDGVQTPHYNYVGDSVLGSRAHLGAGVICSNLRLDKQNVHAKTLAGPTDTGLRKLGALLGEGAEVGCNAALQPGAILGKNAFVTPLIPFSGTLAENEMAYVKPEVRVINRR